MISSILASTQRNKANGSSNNHVLAIIYIAIRVALANKAPISDCDEVYNYWEPVHFLHHGSGMQTWEYAPQYALRTYAYLFPMLFLSKFYQNLLQYLPNFVMTGLMRVLNSSDDANKLTSSLGLFLLSHDYDHHNKVLVFRLMRCTLAVLTALSELRLSFSLEHYINSSYLWNNQKQKQDHQYVVSIWMLFLFLTSAGMFHVSPAYLPSATAMLLFMNSVSCQLNSSRLKDKDLDSNVMGSDTTTKIETDDSVITAYENKDLDGAIVWGLIATLTTGWPFCAVLFIPLGLNAVYRAWVIGGCGSEEQKRSIWCSVSSVLHLLKRTIFYAMTIQCVVTGIDYIYYGKIVSPTMNIFIYNTGLFQSDGINRDDLYGVEGSDYYIKNLLLNWNIIALVGVLSLPSLVLGRLISSRRTFHNMGVEVALIPMYLWIYIVFSRPHKEERFLFPIYPTLVLGSIVVMENVLECIISHLRFRGFIKTDSKHQILKSRNVKLGIGLLLLAPSATTSVMRSMLLVDGYSAPLDLHNHLYYYIQSKNKINLDKLSEPLLVCTGGEWYRFPSSFHLPNNAQLAFLKSSFDGQLPQQFTQYGSKKESLLVQKGTFNDMNEESIDRYVDNIEDCSFVIELVRDTIKESEMENDQPECLDYMRQHGLDKWKEIAIFDFMDIDSTSTLHRLLYLPFFRKATYQKLILFEQR